MSEPRTAAEWWEVRYAESERVWSGRVNAVLADVAATLTPGDAVDLGCGEGGDAIWLASHGWTVTGVDLSPTAVERARAAAAHAGVADRVRFEAADLATWTTSDRFDLVAASFLHSWPMVVPREEILRRATEFVAPGGHLLVTSHAAAPPWASRDGHEHRFPSPGDELATLQLDEHAWRVVVSEIRGREAIGADGRPASLDDSVVLVQRLP